MSAKLTPWFNGTIKPVHIGVYERNLRVNDGRYSYWDGKRWSCAGLSIEDAEKWAALSSGWQRAKWRGLAEKPEDV